MVPNIFHGVQVQQHKKLNIRASIFGKRLMEPFFLPNILTSELCLQILESVINPVLTDTIENDQHYIISQQILRNVREPFQ